MRLESSRGSAKTVPGDIWELGDHELACANLLDADSIDRLMARQHGLHEYSRILLITSRSTAMFPAKVQQGIANLRWPLVR